MCIGFLNQSNAMSALLLVASYVLGLAAAIVAVVVLYNMLIDVLQASYMGKSIALSMRIGLELDTSLVISLGSSLGVVVPSRILGVVS